MSCPLVPKVSRTILLATDSVVAKPQDGHVGLVVKHHDASRDTGDDVRWESCKRYVEGVRDAALENARICVHRQSCVFGLAALGRFRYDGLQLMDISKAPRRSSRRTRRARKATTHE